jgi:hypothetical protein
MSPGATLSDTLSKARLAAKCLVTSIASSIDFHAPSLIAASTARARGSGIFPPKGAIARETLSDSDFVSMTFVRNECPLTDSSQADIDYETYTNQVTPQ